MSKERELKFDNEAYVHKLNAQELGYRGGQPYGAGRYFYISKSCAEFFPHLSEVVPNDHMILDIIPPNSEEIVLTNYVYHNSKYSSLANNENRDEFRIYLNSENDPGRDYFKPDDLIVIVKIRTDDDLIYKIVHISSENRSYKELNKLLDDSTSGRNKTHALIPLSSLMFLDELRKIRIGKKVIPDEILEESLNEPTHYYVEGENEGTRVLRSRSFRDLVLYFYDYRCAITDKKVFIEYSEFNNLEAAHIMARAAGGGSNPANGIALERNLHWAFDKGFFTVSDNYVVKVHPDAMEISYLKKQHGKKLILPDDRRTHPDKGSLKWHRENVFGMFLGATGG
jgi:predicted restriction endonuclease